MLCCYHVMHILQAMFTGERNYFLVSFSLWILALLRILSLQKIARIPSFSVICLISKR